MSDESTQDSTEDRSNLSAAENAGTSFLVYRDGRGAQRIFTLPESLVPVTVGRGSWTDVSIGWDEQASRLHARFERLADDWTVVDEGLSRNGTFVNGERLEGRRRLVDGDEMRFGDTTFRFHRQGQPDEMETVIAPVPDEDTDPSQPG